MPPVATCAVALVSAQVEIAADIGFTEGPLWINGRLLVTSVSRGLVYEVARDGKSTDVFVETGGGPNGIAADADGNVWVAQNGGVIIPSKSSRPASSGLQRFSADGGEVEDVVTGCNAPNDLVVGPDGRVWFTDPFGPHDERTGDVRAYDPEGGELETLLSELEYPNGIAFNAGGDALFVAETRTARILRYAWDGGALGDAEVFATLRVGRPDGMAFDDSGRLYVAGADADTVLVYEADGQEVEAIEFGGLTLPTNVAFIQDALIVTAGKGGRVMSVPGIAQGLALI